MLPLLFPMTTMVVVVSVIPLALEGGGRLVVVVGG